MRATSLAPTSRRFNYRRHPLAARLICEALLRCGGVIRRPPPPCRGRLIEFSCLHSVSSS
jgi:hypothetical protein